MGVSNNLEGLWEDPALPGQRLLISRRSMVRAKLHKSSSRIISSVKVEDGEVATEQARSTSLLVFGLQDHRIQNPDPCPNAVHSSKAAAGRGFHSFNPRQELEQSM